MQSAAAQLEVLMRGVDRVVPEEGLRERLQEDVPLRVKLGLDPTAPDVHLGWAVVLDLLRRFQELGHTAVLIVGDFTAQVGDPSGRSDTRPRLSAEEVAAFAERCLGKITPLLLEDNLEIRYNSEWLAPMDMGDILAMTSQMTVAQMLERDDFATRLGANEPISLLEFMYPLLQATDSVRVAADVELGGADQLWNLLAGRQLQQRHGQRPQVAMTVPLIVGTDGARKMSQSYSNYIAVDEAPGEMFGKVMSIPDSLMPQWLSLVAGLPVAEVEAMATSLADGSAHPGETKRALARAVVARFHDDDAALEAEAAFDRVFRHHDVPEAVPEVRAPEGDPVWLPGALRDAGVVASSSEAKRLLAQGAIKVAGRPVEGEELPRVALIGNVTQIGKRRFVRFVE